MKDLNLSKANPMRLLVILDSLKSENTGQKVSRLTCWKQWFDALGIHAVIHTRDPMESLQEYSWLPFEICSDPMARLARQYNALQNRCVFGRRQDVILSTLILEYEGEAILVRHQISDKSLEPVIKKAMQVQYRWSQENIMKFVDRHF